MALVTVRINGYAHTVGCEDGQEGHLQAMAGEVERRVEDVKALGGQSGEAKLLALAALMMADELHDLAVELAEAKEATRKAQAKAQRLENRTEAKIGKRLNGLAHRAEDIAAGLEAP